MSVTMARTNGVTVLTLTADPESACPPLCQILKGLCYSPVCCSVSQRLKGIQRASQSVLGALHIMVGLLNIGLGAILCCSGSGSGWQMDSTLFPFWFGGVFIFLGVLCILSERCPSPCLVIVNVILNLLVGVSFAIAAIALYSINIADIWLWWMCHNDYYYEGRHATKSPREEILMKKCEEGEDLVLMIVRGLNGLLIVLSAMELCIAISSAVMGIKALRSSEKKEEKYSDDPEHYKPLLENVTSDPLA